MKKYGKPMADVIPFKTDFFEKNDALLAKTNQKRDIYKTGPLREHCVVCGQSLPKEAFFESHDIAYLRCEKCTHINGRYRDTAEFAKAIYLADDYSKSYQSTGDAYWNRVRQIYLPKLTFLSDYLQSSSLEKIRILDIGAGSGYFVAAGILENIDIEGIEISKEQASFANEMLGQNLVHTIEADAIVSEIQNTNASVISAIGVLEHLGNLREVLDAISTNRKIKYLYCSVPMFSLSVMLELMNQDCYNRLLGAGHTHLFTNESLAYICAHYNWEEVASWRFGSDMMDFYRMLSVKTGKFPALKGELLQMDKTLLDEIQLLLDKAEISSEKHLILEIRH